MREPLAGLAWMALGHPGGVAVLPGCPQGVGKQVARDESALTSLQESHPFITGAWETGAGLLGLGVPRT